MPDPSLNPSQQVERIREILVGRQMHHVEERLAQMENHLAQGGPGSADSESLQRLQMAQSKVLRETQELRKQVQEESQLRSQQIDNLAQSLNAASEKLEAASAGLERQDRHLGSHLTKHLEDISAAMAARIDARVREILNHLQHEIGQWKHQIDRDMHSVRNEMVDRTELKNRFARLASAAMEDEPNPATEEDGFLL
jgi:DNA repair exonuclease SbcCD ATPase subunit